MSSMILKTLWEFLVLKDFRKKSIAPYIKIDMILFIVWISLLKQFNCELLANTNIQNSNLK
jgi:hypothetical protein